jgi:hypothetical protein
MTAIIDGSLGFTAPVGAVYNGLQTGTAVASTSGTSIDFTGIPSWVKRITVMFASVSTNGTSPMQIQIGNGSIVTTSYVSTANYSTTTVSSTTGLLANYGNPASSSSSGVISLYNISSNTWVSSGVTADDQARSSDCAGTKILGGTLDRVRITTVNGTDTFDAGSLNILYE